MLEGLQTRGGIDGVTPYAPLSEDGCCSDPLCVDFCTMACSFIGLLPSGPMWDRPKSEAMAYYNGGSLTACDEACTPEFPCPTLVQHSIYTAAKLTIAINEVIWPSIRESSPYTAVTTIDTWLERFEWEDCHRTHCRSVLLGDLTPYEIMGECGPVFCPPDIPDELECAVKHGLLISLQRASRGFVKNLAGINFVIEPLGAVLRPRNADTRECGPSYPGRPSRECCDLEFEICNIGETLEACPTRYQMCNTDDRPDEVQAYVDRGCDIPAGLPQRIWPGVITAECVVRSLMAKACPNIIHRCC